MNKTASALTGIDSQMAKLCLPVFMALAILVVILFAGACSEEKPPEGLFPTQPIPEARNWLFCVCGTDANNIYAAGAKGAMFHFDGDTWKKDPVITSKAITSIWDSGDGTLYATGHGGVILRNTGGSWSRMSSGTSKNLYGIGRFRGSIYACGFEGTLLRFNGSTWGGSPGLTWILDETGAPIDTLQLSEDVASLVTVNSFFIGGAYHDPRFTGQPDGMTGTRGGVFEVAYESSFPLPDPETGDAYKVLPDWILRPLSGEQIVDAEWMLSSTSDPDSLSGNFLGTSEGWLFKLSETRGDTVWTKFYPSVTDNPGAGIQDIWLDAERNIYLATDEGKIIYQTADYDFTEGTGERIALETFPNSLTGIWGTDPSNFYVVGYMDDMLLRCFHDPATGVFSFIEIPAVFDSDKAMDPGPTVDKFGRPLY